MERGFRGLTGLFLSPLVILLVLAAPAAGDGFAAVSYPVTISGTQLGSGPVFGTEAGSVTCESSTLTSPTLSERATSLTLTPTFSNCKAFGSMTATVSATGCTFVLKEATETEFEKFEGSMDLNCESEQSIVISTLSCEAQISGQTGLKTMKYVNQHSEVPSNFAATFSLSGVKYTVTKDGFGCPFTGTGAKTSGTFSDEAVVKAAKEGLAQDAAVRPDTKLCTAIPTGTPLACPAKSDFTGKKMSTSLVMTEATWTDPSGPVVSCDSSSMAIELNAMGWTLGGAGGGVTGMTFSSKGGECTSTYTKNPRVAVTMENLSYDGTWVIYRPAVGTQGRLSIAKDGGAVRVKLLRNEAGAENCLYQPSNGLVARWVNGTGTNPSSIEFVNQAFSRSGGILCPLTMSFDAAYNVVQAAGGNVYVASK